MLLLAEVVGGLCISVETSDRLLTNTPFVVYNVDERWIGGIPVAKRGPVMARVLFWFPKAGNVRKWAEGRFSVHNPKCFLADGGR